ncbi:hypothetical protein SLA2020_067040 [Shorea laevis]
MVNTQLVPAGDASRVGQDTPILRLASKATEHGELHRVSFVGQLLAEEEDIRSGVVYNILKSAWRPKGGFELHEQSKNTYIFILSDDTEKNRIFRESPWFVKGSHLILKDWLASQRFDEIVFSRSEFWVQVHGLPKGCMTLENIQLIGSLFPRLISWDQSTVGGLESFLRLRVEIDVHMPLLTGFQFQQQGDEMWTAEFKYEKLVDFCYKCGMLGHTTKSCDDLRWKADDGNISQPRPQYGPQMRAAAYSPRKHFGSIREGKKSFQPHQAKQTQGTKDRLEAVNLAIPPNSAGQKLVVGDEEPSEMERDLQPEEERVNQPLHPFLGTIVNKIEMQSSSGMITTLKTNPELPLIPPVIQLQTPPSLNVTVTKLLSSELDKHLDSSHKMKEKLAGQDGVRLNTELGLLLSQQVEAQLSLGNNSKTGRKRKNDTGSEGEILKKACIQPSEPIGLQCPPNQLQEAMTEGRSDSYKQDTKGFLTNVEESISVHRVRRRIRLKGLARQVQFQPDSRVSLLQPCLSTQRSIEEPPFIPLISNASYAPSNFFTESLISPSTITEQYADDMLEGASVAGPWQPPPPA